MGGKLHNPGPGDLADRLTVLALKVVLKPFEGQPSAGYIEERAGVEIALHHQQGLSPDASTRLAQMVDLATLNAAIWMKEDELRALRNAMQPGATVAQLQNAGAVGMQIQALNDRRNA